MLKIHISYDIIMCFYIEASVGPWMIHRNVFVFNFLILLLSGWVVAASFMAEKTNVRMAGLIADITSMCGFGSDWAAALLSACSFVRCCSHQFVFSCLDVLY